jgi:hypothetical protein
MTKRHFTQAGEQRTTERSTLGCTSKSTLRIDPTTPVPASRLVRTVGPSAWPSLWRVRLSGSQLVPKIC